VSYCVCATLFVSSTFMRHGNRAREEYPHCMSFAISPFQSSQNKIHDIYVDLLIREDRMRDCQLMFDNLPRHTSLLDVA